MTWWPRVRWWVDGIRRDRDIGEEMRTHLDMATARYVGDGVPADEARRRAEREFGNATAIRQATREVWTWAWLEHLVQDARFGSLILWQAPSVSVTAVVLIALVIGGNATVYSIVRMLLTNPAAGVAAERLIVAAQITPSSDEPFISYPDYADLASRRDVIDRAAAWTAERLTVGVDGVSYAVFGGLVTSSYFDTLGVRARLGRTLTSADDVTRTEGLVAVVSERFWKERLGESPAVVGHAVVVNGQPATIIGVAAGGFRGATLTPGEDMWVPLGPYYAAIASEAILADRGQPLVLMVAQLAPGVTRASAQGRFGTVAAQLAAAYPRSNKDHRIAVSDYSATALLPVSRMARPFLALFGVVTLLTLVVVSANVANLMLVRALVRQREIAVRQSVGATRARVIRLLVAEGLAVSVVAGAAASAVAWAMSRVLIRLVGPGSGGVMDTFTPDWWVVAYAMGLALVATVAFTTAPGLRTWRQPVLPWLKAGEQSVAPGRSRLASALVVTQLAFSVVLLTSAGLAYRSLALLDSGDVGFDARQLLLVTIRAGDRGAFVDRGTSPPQRAAAFARLERLRERIAADPQVAAVTYMRRIPGPYLNVGVPVRRPGAEPRSAIRRPVGPGYLRTLGLVPRAGRDISESDGRGRPRVAVINEHLATALWPGASPLGQVLSVGAAEQVEVVGVAPNAFFDGPSHDRRPQYVFVAEQQADGEPALDPTMLVRYRGALESATPAVGAAIADVDPNLPIVTTATMATRLRMVAEIERMVTRMLVVFAALALVVASLGLYAVAAFNMRRRTRDFGVRLAMGASPHQVRQGVLAESLRLAIAGLLLGGAVSAAVAAAAGRVLIGVTPTDPPTYASVFAVLTASALLAAMVPAWQAGRVNVIEALRQD